MDCQISCECKNKEEIFLIVWNDDISIKFRTSRLIDKKVVAKHKYTIPYFIHCLQTGKNYSMEFSKHTCLVIKKDLIIITGHVSSIYITLKFLIEDYESIFVHELSKLDYKSDDRYMKIMDQAIKYDIVFMKNRYNYPIKTDELTPIIIDGLTEEIEEEFKLLFTEQIHSVVIDKTIYTLSHHGFTEEWINEDGRQGNVTTLENAVESFKTIF